MDNFQLYKHLSDIYNIKTDTYAIDYVTPSSASSEFQMLRNYYDLSEHALMQILFTKSIQEKEYNENNRHYANFILKEKYIVWYNDANYDDNIVYYEYDMKKALTLTYTDEKIIDFDLSFYASVDTRYYLFYLDTIAQLYAQAYDKKLNNMPLVSNRISLKSRYAKTSSIYDISLIRTHQGYTEFYLDVNMNEITYEVIDVQLSGVDVGNGFTIFKNDILQHLRYLCCSDDIKYTGLDYLKTVEYFYRLCRLKLSYMIANCIRSLPHTDADVAHNEISNYILEKILPVLVNFRTAIENEILQSDAMKMSKTVKYNKAVLESSTELHNINKQIKDNKEKIELNESLIYSIQQDYDNIQGNHITCTILLFAIIFVSILIFFISLDQNVKGMISLVMTIVVLVFMIFIYVSLASSSEYFEDNPVAYPSFQVTSNNRNYGYGFSARTIVIGGSSVASGSDYWHAFDNNQDTMWKSADNKYNTNGEAISEYMTQYKGEYLKIDLGEYVVLSLYSIITNSANSNSYPKKLRLYGTNSSDAWVNSNSDKWILLSDQDNVTYQNNLKSFGFRSTLPPYRYYMLIVNKINQGTKVEIKTLTLFGNKYIQTAIITSEPKRNVDKDDEVALPVMPLPDNYDDVGLINWDIELNANKKTTSGTVNAYLDLSISDNPYAFDNSIKKTYTNQTYSLDIYKSGYITGYVVNNANSIELSDVYYKLTVRYYPMIQDEDQTAKLSSIFGIFDEEKLKRDTFNLLTASESTYSSVLNTCNLEYSRLSRIRTTAIDTCNILKDQLRDQGTMSDLLRIINSSNQILLQEINNSNYFQQKLLENTRILKEKNDVYSQNADIITSLTNSLNALRQKRTQTLAAFENYMTASEKELYDGIADSYEGEEYGNILLENAAIRNMSNMVKQIYETTVTRQPLIKGIQDETKNKLSLKAKYDLDASMIDYENSLRNDLINSTQKINDDFIDTLQQLQTRFDELSSPLSTARTARDQAKTYADERLQAFNEEYDTSYTSLEKANAGLRKDIDKQNALIATANQEYADLSYDEAEAMQRTRTATITYLFYDALRQETQESLNYYRNTVIPLFDRQLTTLADEKSRLNDQLRTLTQNANQLKSDAQAEFEKLAIRKALEINELKDIRAQNIQEIANQSIRRQRKIQEAIDAKNNRDKIEKDLQEWVKKKSKVDSEATFYKGISDEMKADINEYEVLKDADTIIIYSMNDNINGINHDLIVPNITNEYYNFDKYRKEIKNHASQSESEVNNRILNMKYMEARTILFLHLTLIISLCMTIYYYMSSNLAIIIAIIASTIALIIYSFSTTRLVRNRARQYYW